METLGALVIIVLVVAAVVWLLVRRPRSSTEVSVKAPEPPGESDHLRELLSAIKVEVEVRTRTARERYDEDYPTEIVGESHYQAAIRALAEAHPDRGPLDHGAECAVRAMLVPEMDNPYDANAVRVEVDGRQVGRLSRADAVRYRLLVGLGRAQVGALIVGGWDRGPEERGFHGVRLALKMEEAELRALQAVASSAGELPLPVNASPLVGQLEPRDDEAFPVDVMGEVRHQHALEKICAGRLQEGSVLIVPARCIPGDRDDTGGVRVEIGGKTVGYLTSGPAWIYTMTMDGVASECRARIHGGADHGVNTNAGHYGVRLDLVLRELPAEIAPHRGASDYACEIMGESNCQPALRSIIERRRASKPAAWVSLLMAKIEPDSANPPRAHVMIDGQSVGYLGKANSRKYCTAASGQVREVPARITTSQDVDGRPRYGVSLELRFDE